MFKSKVYRLFCFLFAFSLVFALFGVEASAASDNLISPDITTWTDWSDLQDGTNDMVITNAGNIYRVSIYSGGDSTTILGAVFDHTSLIAGHSYSLSFKMPGRSEINTAFDKTYSSNVFETHFSKCYVSVGVGFVSSSGDLNIPSDLILYQITPSNYQSILVKR